MEAKGRIGLDLDPKELWDQWRVPNWEGAT
jgi:hypothetical protein